MTLSLETIWTPTAKQQLLLSCPVYEVMFGGAAGGGKSDALLLDHVKQHRVVHEHYQATGIRTRGRAILLRKEFGRLKDLMFRAANLFPVVSGGKMRWRENDHMWYCECGYRFEFGHLEGAQDHLNYVGQEFSAIYIDQVEEIPYEQYSMLKTRVRTSEEILKPLLCIRLTANPMGRHADWVKKRFVEPNRKGFQVITEVIETSQGPVERTRVFIPSTLRDNPYLPKEYEAELLSAPEHIRRALLDGDWDVTPGSFFGDVFDPRIHVIDDLGPTEIRIPSNWPVFRAGDWGSRAPACCLWIAVDNDGLLIVLDELYGPGEEATRWAKRILAIEEKWGWAERKEGIVYAISKLEGWVDPAAFASHDGPPVSEKMFELGVNWYPAENERKAGWAEVRRRLMERGGASFKIPGLRVTRRCTNLIRTLPNLTSPESDSHGDMDDIDTKQEDHACFVAGTSVLMADGSQQYIETIRPGMSIMTPAGPRDVIDAMMTAENAECVTMDWGALSTLTGTANHPIYTPAGKIPLGDLREGSEVIRWSRPSSTTESYSVDTQDQSAWKTATTSSLPAQISQEEWSHSIARSGSASAGQYLQGSTFTMGLLGQASTQSTTSNAWQAPIISASMPGTILAQSQLSRVSAQQSGIAQQQGGLGMLSTDAGHGLAANPLCGGAAFAGKSLATSQIGASSAGRTAKHAISVVVSVKPARRSAGLQSDGG